MHPPPSSLPTLARPGPGERMALAGAAALLLLQAMPAGLQAALEYRSALAASAPWRLLTAQLVHLNWPHALVNAAAWWIVARLFAAELAPRRQAAVIAAGALAVAGALPLAPLAGYRGFSGVLHALFFAGALGWLLAALRPPAPRRTEGAVALLLLASGGAKLALELAAPAAAHPAWLGAAIAPHAHLAGAGAGLAVAAVWAARMRGWPTPARRG